MRKSHGCWAFRALPSRAFADGPAIMPHRPYEITPSRRITLHAALVVALA